MFNEITTVVLVDTITVFSAANLSRFDLPADIAFLVCLFGNLSVHLFFLIKSSILGAKLKIRKRRQQGKSVCCCCSKPKQNKAKRATRAVQPSISIAK
mmetsp:Transcript_15832/g.21425  ORF Transcript_15832/g.21425 Transcript_15832/m.21425 type:complete len:98 (-) Transcript_15832:493-786(-)